MFIDWVFSDIGFAFISQITHKHYERRLLVAESCGVLAPYIPVRNVLSSCHSAVLNPNGDSTVSTYNLCMHVLCVTTYRRNFVGL